MVKGFQDERYRALIMRLVNARREAGLSQADVAARLNHHQQFVSRYETGERRLDAIEFVDIATALGQDALSILAETIGPSATDR